MVFFSSAICLFYQCQHCIMCQCYFNTDNWCYSEHMQSPVHNCTLFLIAFRHLQYVTFSWICFLGSIKNKYDEKTTCKIKSFLKTLTICIYLTQIRQCLSVKDIYFFFCKILIYYSDSLNTLPKKGHFVWIIRFTSHSVKVEENEFFLKIIEICTIY